MVVIIMYEIYTWNTHEYVVQRAILVKPIRRKKEKAS